MENYIFDKPQKAFSIKAHDDDICLKVFRLQHIHAALFAASRPMAVTFVVRRVSCIGRQTNLVLFTPLHQITDEEMIQLHVVRTLFQIHTYF